MPVKNEWHIIITNVATTDSLNFEEYYILPEGFIVIVHEKSQKRTGTIMSFLLWKCFIFLVFENKDPKNFESIRKNLRDRTFEDRLRLLKKIKLMVESLF